MTQKRRITISPAKADSGNIGSRSYGFVFSDNIEDWHRSSNRANSTEYNKQYYKRKKNRHDL